MIPNLPVPARMVEIWVYLSAGPLLWLTLTLGAYAVAARIATATGRHPLANPVAIATVFLVALLKLTRTDYGTYFAGAQFVHFLLGPATVALAVPLYRNRGIVRATLLPMIVALICGSLTAILTSVCTGKLLHLPREMIASMAPKSVTTPIAMSLSANFGGIPTLTAVAVICAGILGAIVYAPLMNAMRIQDHPARGFAAGIAAHGLGTARAFSDDPVAGTFAGIGMGLNGFVTSILIPLLAFLWK